MRRLLAAGCCACVALGGCGSNDEGKVRSAVKQLYAGFADRDAEKVCDSLTRHRQQLIANGAGQGKRTCPQVMGVGLGLVGDAFKDAESAEVTKVQLRGGSATATVEYKGRPDKLPLVKENGDWKVAALDPNQL